jgi:hypothetical protein
MRTILLGLIAAGVAVTATPALAREGCGPGGHRGPYGHCRPNRGGPAVVAAPGVRLVIGNYYHGRGYWDGRRYYQHRRQWRGGWRYY